MSSLCHITLFYILCLVKWPTLFPSDYLANDLLYLLPCYMLSLASLLGMPVVPDLILLLLCSDCELFALCLLCVCVCVLYIFTFLLGFPASPQPVSPTSQSLRPPLHKGTSDLEAPLAANMSNINFWLSKFKLDANALGHLTLNITFLTKFFCKSFHFVKAWGTQVSEISSSFVHSHKTNLLWSSESLRITLIPVALKQVMYAGFKWLNSNSDIEVPVYNPCRDTSLFSSFLCA